MATAKCDVIQYFIFIVTCCFCHAQIQSTRLNSLVFTDESDPAFLRVFRVVTTWNKLGWAVRKYTRAVSAEQSFTANSVLDCLSTAYAIRCHAIHKFQEISIYRWILDNSFVQFHILILNDEQYLSESKVLPQSSV
jgi:hypothetical protein